MNDRTTREHALRLVHPDVRGWPVVRWWGDWLDLQRRQALDADRLEAAEALVGRLGAEVGSAIVGTLTIDQVRSASGDEVDRLPIPLPAILATPSAAPFIDAWIALATTVLGLGGTSAASPSSPR